MGLKPFFITLSSLLVFFCINLILQTDQSVQSINLDSAQFDSKSNTGTNLSTLVNKIKPKNLDYLLEEIIAKNKSLGLKTRVMEIGLGDGLVLMELKKKFPEVEFYGIAKKKTHSFFRRESFYLTAIKNGVFTKEELEHTELPYIVFQDLDFGRRIPYGDEKFDLVFSIRTMPQIRYKIELINEVLRVLKPDGITFHTDLTRIKFYDRGVVLDTDTAMDEVRKKGFLVEYHERDQMLWLKKGRSFEPLPLAPHSVIPSSLENLSGEQLQPEMNYNLI